jgi:Uma2 family endonuclease
MKPLLPARVSESEFLSWPESMQKVELIDGDVVRSPSATFGHQEVLRRILAAFVEWERGRVVTIGQSPCDVRFAPGRILQPDAFVILDRVPFDVRGPLDRVPEICIEVLSQDVAYDRQTKPLIYAGAGVRELWTVSLGGYVEQWTGPGLASVETITGTLRSPLLPGFELDVPALFAAR